MPPQGASIGEGKNGWLRIGSQRTVQLAASVSCKVITVEGIRIELLVVLRGSKHSSHPLSGRNKQLNEWVHGDKGVEVGRGVAVEVERSPVWLLDSGP